MTCDFLIDVAVPHCPWTNAFRTFAPLSGKVPLRRLHHLKCLGVWHSTIITLWAHPSWCLIRYWPTQKGNHVYFSNQHKYIVTPNVTFFKSIRYFSPSSSSPLPTPLPSLVVTSPPSLGLEDPPTPPLPLPLPPSPPSPALCIPAFVPSLDKFSASCSSTTLDTFPSNDLHLPIALKKGNQVCTLHIISHFFYMMIYVLPIGPFLYPWPPGQYPSCTWRLCSYLPRRRLWTWSMKGLSSTTHACGVFGLPWPILLHVDACLL